MRQPKVTVGIISFNRLYYLRATLNSALECLNYPDIEWLVVDASTESGVREYLDGVQAVRKIYLPPSSTHIDSMNTLVEESHGEYVLIWPDDVQFIVRGDWLQDCIEIMQRHAFIGSMGLDCLRSQTVQGIWGWKKWAGWRLLASEFKHHGWARRQRTLVSRRGLRFRSYGWTAPGIIGSGIPSLARTSLWRALGPWKYHKSDASLVDSSGGGELEMLGRYAKKGCRHHRAIPVIPVAADIVTDDKGTKAKVRNGKRYGNYMKPVTGDYYYRILDEAKLLQVYRGRTLPVGFKELVAPLGYSLARDSLGERLKCAINRDIVSDIR